MKEWSDFCLTKAVNGVVELSGEPLPASAELKKNLLGIFTDFEKSPIGVAQHIKTTAEIFVPALPRTLSELKSVREKAAQALVDAAKRRAE